MPGVGGWRRSTQGAWSGAGGRAARRAAWAGAVAALVVFLLLATAGRPWALFERGPFTSDFYDVQARALSRGHLDVPPEVAGVEGYVDDGRTHFYYGLVPALARLPVAAVTDAVDGRLVVVSQLLGLGVAALAGARLLQRARTAIGVDVPARWWPWLTGGFAAAVGLATPLLWLSAEALVYHEAELWGAALALVGVERVVVWWGSRRPADLAWASGAAALALSTRGSSGTGPAIALGGLAVVLAVGRRWRAAAWALGAAAVPFVLYAGVNLARFDTPLAIPFDRQVLNEFSEDRRAALAANDGTLFGLQFLPTTALQYLRPDTIEPRSLLPWFSWGPDADVVGDVRFDTVDRSASLPVTAPAFVVAAAVGVVALVRRRLPAAWPVSVAACAVAVLPTLSLAFVAQRYLADFVPFLVVAAAVGVPVVAAWAATSRLRRTTLAAAGVSLVTVGLVVNAGLSVLGRQLYLIPSVEAQRDFVALQYAVDDALGGDPPPDVVAVAALGPVGPDGQVAVVGECDALYRSDGESWRLLELRPGGPQRLVVDGSRPGTVVAGDGWRVELVAVGDGRRLDYVGPGTVTGRVVDGTGPLRVDVAADAVLPTVRVQVDGEAALEAFLQPAGGPLRPGPGWTSIPGQASLCDDLAARLG